MDLTVGELKRMLDLYPDDYPVEFQPAFLPNGSTARFTFYRIKDRGVCHFEWNPVEDEDLS